MKKVVSGLSERLKKKRTQFNYSRQFVADRIGVSHNMIVAYEYGTKAPSLVMLSKLADVYLCSTDYLLGRSTQDDQIIIDAKGLTDNEMEAVVHLIQVMRNG